eukprot:169097-Alexandrium_andersonii.AAC.1
MEIDGRAKRERERGSMGLGQLQAGDAPQALDQTDAAWVAATVDDSKKVIVELCCEPDSALGRMAEKANDAKVIRITRQVADVSIPVGRDY